MGSTTTTTTITTISSDGGNLSSIDQSVESPAQSVISLQQPNVKRTNTSRPKKLFRQVRSIFRSLPIITTAACKFPTGNRIQDGQINGTRMTGTLFGHKKARVSLAIQDSSSSLPLLLLELGMPTGKLLQSMGNGMVRIAMECEKRSGKDHNKTKIADEPVWTMFCNGRKTGFGVRREATEEDLRVMQTLRVISQGAGVIPEAAAAADGGVHSDGELAYMRAHFERVVGSRDSETYYMMNPDGNSGPELSIFFVRV
ncbi:Protein MIZU-KUSSEI 1 [Linum perenne]